MTGHFPPPGSTAGWNGRAVANARSEEGHSPMCKRTRCPTCGLWTWQGCGHHIDQALAGIPQDQRCPGHKP